ncbi:MAG: UTP--glucose-1-phosphate uridylyltransferase [Spirochaetales bacterium]|nr:UTP--glucose-1-phosphate uridylyltransferase [Spirochaetales bacterium]MCF7938658.1 UTP--glucose-1-phosphate uridylyltransferase [Spirochaetales bacterium]
MKGVIVAAGYGTRFLPVTKTVAKEMLPIITKPSIAYIIEEFIDSGIEDIIIISSRRKRSLEDYLDREMELETVFRAEGAEDKLRAIEPYQARFSFVRQQRMLGTGHALMQISSLVGREPFIVAYPDDLHFGNPPLSAGMIETHQQTGCSVLATIHDPPNLERYGVLRLAEDNLHVTGMVEKPAPGTEPSKEVSIGRYLYTATFLEYLQEGWEKHLEAGNAGEYFHLYALEKLMEEGAVVHHPLPAEERIDTGSPAGYLRAILKAAAADAELRPVLEKEIKNLQG